MRKPLTAFKPDCYRFRWLDDKIEFQLERVHEARGGDLTAEMQVTTDRNGTTELLHMAKLNLVSSSTRSSVLRALRDRIDEKVFDWPAALEYVCYASVQQWRDGEPVVDLREVEQRPGTRFLLEPYIEQGGATVLFAMGGAGKSMFGLALGVSIASGMNVLGRWPTLTAPVLYLDWESDKYTHADRRRAICAGVELPGCEAPVFYRRQSASLSESAAHIRRMIGEHQVGLIIIDSLGAARGGEPESAESTLRLFNAARSLDVPFLCIDHVTKNGGEGQTTPFGSVYTHNMARMTWGLEKVEDCGNGSMTIALTNHKSNNGRLLRRQAYEVEFREDADGRPTYVEYRSVDAREVPAVFNRMSQSDQIAEVLRRNRAAMTVEDIQSALEGEGATLKADQVRVVLNKYSGRFVRRDGAGKGHWGLLAAGV